MSATPKEIVLALQYLYYTGDGLNRLGGSPKSDYEYDAYCELNGIPPNGGSDRERDYSKPIIALAEKISKGEMLI